MSCIKRVWRTSIVSTTPFGCIIMDGVEYGKMEHPPARQGDAECRCVVVNEVQSENSNDGIADLKRRLSQYECPEHEAPKTGECEECDKHNQQPQDRMSQ